MSTDRYISHFNDMISGENWVGLNVGNILKIDSQKAFRKPIEGKHNIYELLHHITAWRQFLIARLSGDIVFDIELNSSADWPSDYKTTSESWDLMVNKFREGQNELLKILKGVNESMLEETVPGRAYNYHRLIEGVIQHDFYHFGQAAQLNS